MGNTRYSLSMILILAIYYLIEKNEENMKKERKKESFVRRWENGQ